MNNKFIKHKYTPMTKTFEFILTAIGGIAEIALMSLIVYFGITLIVESNNLHFASIGILILYKMALQMAVHEIKIESSKKSRTNEKQNDNGENV